jgi:Tfp pilus assembly protein PilO
MAAVQRPSINKIILQQQLNKFYSHPVARVSFGLILTILAVTFFGLVAIKPTLETMANLIKQIDDRRIVDQKLSLKIAALSAAQTELSSKQQASAILDLAVPSTPTFPQLLKQIEKAAAENNVTIGTLIAQTVPIERDPASVTTTDLESIPINVSVGGDYTGILGMLSALTNMQRILVIDRIDILPPSEKETGVLNMSVSMRAFAFGSQAISRPRTATTTTPR